jgi:rhamnose transport system permease protein
MTGITARARLRGILARRVWVTVGVLVGALVVSSLLSPYFLDPNNLSTMTTNFMEDGIMSLSMTLIIVCGEIDLSVASMLNLTAAVFGKLYDARIPLWPCMGLALLFGAALGLVNGLLIARFRIPSLVATLGTLSLYGGLTSALLGSASISDFPPSFVGINLRNVGDTLIPLPLVIFLVDSLQNRARSS